MCKFILGVVFGVALIVGGIGYVGHVLLTELATELTKHAKESATVKFTGEGLLCEITAGDGKLFGGKTIVKCKIVGG